MAQLNDTQVNGDLVVADKLTVKDLEVTGDAILPDGGKADMIKIGNSYYTVSYSSGTLLFTLAN